VARARLTFRRLSGLDRSGPPPPETLPGQPLRPWTIPNAIGFTRLALVPIFLVWALSTETGTEAGPALLYAFIAWTDYADGIAARLTGQYSRLGALLDPVVDRMLVVSGAVVCFRFDLLPRWALLVLAAREVFILVAGRIAVSRGRVLRINWWGRWAVWPVMGALFAGLVGLERLGAVLLYVGLAMTLVATWRYVADAVREPSTSG
jgi:CDP-diacylglycerol--glycerol-3-phosphate 3-phosphatidyltransferase